ncbi:hypothetical protein Slin15195_G071770 [Septoria linicola]|uniref:Uncharacterized protein n=1 Tax=Septoria linicola TaxID=215465 RepID=A0A9Q9AVA7_9PEZI|nr:hypothetical protein Slin15195_G071770 [Septoria linicola]
MAAFYATFIVMFSAALSFTYKILASLGLRKTHLVTITAIQAFALEALQWTLLIGFALSWNILLQSPVQLYSYKVLDVGLHISTWLASVGILTIYALAIFAIDIIDNLVQLKTWRHPVQTQTFLLTRSILFPATIKRTSYSAESTPAVPSHEKARGRSRTRKVIVSSRPPIDRTCSEPATPTRTREMGVNFPSETRNALVGTGSIKETYGSSRYKPRIFSTPTALHKTEERPAMVSSSNSTSGSMSTPASIVDTATSSGFPGLHQDSDATPSPELFSHGDTLHKTTPTLAVKIEQRTPSVEQQSTSASPPHMPRTPWKQPPTNCTPFTPTSPQSPFPLNLKIPPPAFAASTVNYSLKMRPQPRVRTMSAQMVRKNGVGIKGVRPSSALSGGSMGRGSASSVREARKMFEE